MKSRTAEAVMDLFLASREFFSVDNPMARETEVHLQQVAISAADRRTDPGVLTIALSVREI
jgi:hypothetical protein